MQPEAAAAMPLPNPPTAHPDLLTHNHIAGADRRQAAGGASIGDNLSCQALRLGVWHHKREGASSGCAIASGTIHADLVSKFGASVGIVQLCTGRGRRSGWLHTAAAPVQCNLNCVRCLQRCSVRPTTRPAAASLRPELGMSSSERLQPRCRLGGTRRG